jgi:hypothetical protein
MYRRFPNLLFRRLPSRQTLKKGDNCGFGNPRYGRLGSLRYDRTFAEIAINNLRWMFAGNPNRKS